MGNGDTPEMPNIQLQKSCYSKQNTRDPFHKQRLIITRHWYNDNDAALKCKGEIFWYWTEANNIMALNVCLIPGAPFTYMVLL